MQSNKHGDQWKESDNYPKNISSAIIWLILLKVWGHCFFLLWHFDRFHLAHTEKITNTDSTNVVELKILKTTDQLLRKNIHRLDISEHQALATDEYLSNICVSHIESAILVYVMTENDYERAIDLQRAMRCIETLENQPLFK